MINSLKEYKWHLLIFFGIPLSILIIYYDKDFGLQFFNAWIPGLLPLMIGTTLMTGLFPYFDVIEQLCVKNSKRLSGFAGLYLSISLFILLAYPGTKNIGIYSDGRVRWVFPSVFIIATLCYWQIRKNLIKKVKSGMEENHGINCKDMLWEE
ncbi:MAG: hypothetical protein KJ915_10140 [Candidatus Omnitrophica bacterium]|nr:hypothetical protein [Candidatus Omnitrophota bacterium]